MARAGTISNNAKLTFYDYRKLCGNDPRRYSATCRALAANDHYAAANFGKIGDRVTVTYRGKSTTVTILDRGGGVPKGFNRWMDLSPRAFQDLAPLSAGALRGARLERVGGSSKLPARKQSPRRAGARGGNPTGAAGGASTPGSTRSRFLGLGCDAPTADLIVARLGRVAAIGQTQREEEIDDGLVQWWFAHDTAAPDTPANPRTDWQKEIGILYGEISATLQQKCGRSRLDANTLAASQVVVAYDRGVVTDNPITGDNPAPGNAGLEDRVIGYALIGAGALAVVVAAIALYWAVTRERGSVVDAAGKATATLAGAASAVPRGSFTVARARPSGEAVSSAQGSAQDAAESGMREAFAIAKTGDADRTARRLERRGSPAVITPRSGAADQPATIRKPAPGSFNAFKRDNPGLSEPAARKAFAASKGWKVSA